MPIYATKSALKSASGVDTWNFSGKAYLARLQSDVHELDIEKLKNVLSDLDSLKSKVDKLDADRLLPVPTDLRMPSYLVKNEVVKKRHVWTLVSLLKNRFCAKVNKIKEEPLLMLLTMRYLTLVI